VAAPAVSVCIPTYNQTRVLARVLESVLQQRFGDFELVISDDTGEDRVEALAREYDFGGRLRYYRNSTPLGSPANWNRCIELATAPLVKLLHHDDWFTDPESLEELVGAMAAKPNAVLGIAATHLHRPDFSLLRTHRLGVGEVERISKDPYELYFGNRIGSPSVTIVRRTAILYDVRLKWLVDIDYYIRILESRADIAYVDRPLICTMIDGADQMTALCATDPSVDIGEHLYVLEKHFPHLKDRTGLVRYLSRVLGMHGLVDPEDVSRYVDLSRVTDDTLHVVGRTNPAAEYARVLIARANYAPLGQLHLTTLRRAFSGERLDWRRYFELLAAAGSELILVLYRCSPAWVKSVWRRTRALWRGAHA
jgi:glycosyltransferase involved in cell wall biosynthesis